MSCNSIWFSCVKLAENEQVRVFCFPHAGAGPTAYASWIKELPKGMSFFPVQYPEREKRAKDPLHNSIEELACSIARDNIDIFREKDFVFLGHCEGALIAYETAKYLEKEYGIITNLLVVSGANSPSFPTEPIDENMNLEQITAFFVKLGFIKAEMANKKMYIDYFVPILRKDYILQQKYLDKEKYKLESDILILGGKNDNVVCEDGKLDWKNYTTKKVKTITYDGEHFYFSKENIEDIFRQIGGYYV